MNLFLMLALMVGAADKHNVEVWFFSADWCSPCKTMKATTWKDKELNKVLKDNVIPVIPINIDIQKSWTQNWDVKVVPTTIIVRRTGKNTYKEIKRYIGFTPAKTIIKDIKEIKKKYEMI